MGAVLLIGAVLGVLAGWRFKVTHYAWFEWRKTVAAVPILRKLFYRSAWSIAGWVLVGLVLLVAAVRW
ncbi:MAG TPA: hypothetical protein VH092_23555 [Urbifossiella sp.]|nr:hypothetical protein [Urbifossiella sp.]